MSGLASDEADFVMTLTTIITDSTIIHITLTRITGKFGEGFN